MVIYKIRPPDGLRRPNEVQGSVTELITKGE